MAAPSFPPLFRPMPVAHGATVDRACAEAAGGAGAGTLLWSRRRDRLDVAVVLEPDRPLGAALPVVPLAALALADTLAGAGPANVAVTIGWPDRVAVNGALVGGVRLAVPPGASVGAIPEWLVLAVLVDVLGDPGDVAPGRHPQRTALREEGFGDLDVGDLIEGFSRYLALWTHRWLEDGLTAVHAAWLGRLEAAGGPVHGLDPSGALLVGDGRGGVRRLDLANVLTGPSWALPEPLAAETGAETGGAR